ncbi:MAG: hypothetical protein HC902_08355 [Calothrix sp. SM1_5_4]|nr:hypothetical protein [Calothrix sp. SM1_5_4]
MAGLEAVNAEKMALLKLLSMFCLVGFSRDHIPLTQTFGTTILSDEQNVFVR